MRKHATAGQQEKTPKLTVAQIEDLFVEKLQEKYQLTTRDIQRAFKRFDKDGSGLLSIAELTRAIRFFLNGVDESQVQELANRYDVDGDGEISLDEFSQFLLSRNAIDPQDWLTVDHLTTSKRGDSHRSSSANRNLSSQDGARHSAASSDDIPTNAERDDGTSIEYEAKVFLNNLKLSLLRKTGDMRNEGKLTFQERAGQHFRALAESKARSMILSAFQPYTQGKGATTVDYATFKRVISKYVYPGSPSPRESLLRFLFVLCAPLPNSSTRSEDTAGSNRCDPDVLVSIMFGSDETIINKFGFSESTKSAIDTGRPDNGYGPLRVTAAEPALRISDVPFRFITRKCRTSLATPSNFNMNLLRKSATLPEYACQRSYAIGLNCSLNSGDMLYSMTSLENPGVSTSSDDDSSLLLYSTAAIGVIHNMNTNTQQFFDGHTDDIACIAISNDRSLAATGQVGKSPEVRIDSIVYYFLLLLPN